MDALTPDHGWKTSVCNWILQPLNKLLDIIKWMKFNFGAEVTFANQKRVCRHFWCPKLGLQSNHFTSISAPAAGFGSKLLFRKLWMNTRQSQRKRNHSLLQLFVSLERLESTLCEKMSQEFKQWGLREKRGRWVETENERSHKVSQRDMICGSWLWFPVNLSFPLHYSHDLTPLVASSRLCTHWLDE